MEGIIKVDPQKLISTSEQFGTTGSQIKSLTDQMISIVDSLKSSWQGDAATSYNTKFRQLDNDMQKMYSMIQEHVSDLNEMAQKYIAAENANVELGSQLAGDVIS
jgi:WXG100 family type VII secretion target